MIHLYDKDAEALSVFLQHIESNKPYGRIPQNIDKIWEEITYQLVQQKLNDKN